MKKTTVIIGDVHGCVDELSELLNKISYNPAQMELVFLGDLVDRGPDSIGAVAKVMELGSLCIMGNHENKHIRWRKHENKRKATGKPNPMKPMHLLERKCNEELTDDQMNWLCNLPLKLDLGDGLWAVHGGCEPRFSLHEQRESQLLRARFIDSNGKAVSLNPDKSQPEGTQYWAALWNGPESIVYGHCVHEGYQPRVDTYMTHMCLGIDTGCCFGGSLTAAVDKGGSFELVSVKARREYCRRAGE